MAATVDGATGFERASGPAVPIMENRLQTRLVQAVKQDLPGSGNIPVAVPKTPPRISTNLKELLAQYLLDQHMGGPCTDAGDSEKLPSETWKGTIDLLLHLTQKASQEDLPDLWHSWANCKKDKLLAVLQEHLQNMAQKLNLPKPVATVELTSILYLLYPLQPCMRISWSLAYNRSQ
jgi:hypothetical protein